MPREPDPAQQGNAPKLHLSSVSPYQFKKIKTFGLGSASAGVMWVLEKVFKLLRQQMLCPPDKSRGEHIYRSAIEGGIFGRTATWKKGTHSALRRMLDKRVYALSWLGIDPLYVIPTEFQSWNSGTLKSCFRRLRKN